MAMNFSTDRDLLVLEPHVFRDALVVGQQRLSVADGVVSGTTLSSASADFVSAQVDTGGVVLVSGVALEVVARVGVTDLTVSLLRADVNDPAIAPAGGSGLPVVVRTFAQQAAAVRGVLLGLVGIDEEDTQSTLTAGSIVSRGVMARLEALGTLEQVYAGAVSVVGENAETRQKMREYGRRFNAACRSATVLLDVDGDGVAEVRRSLGSFRISRV